MGNEAITAVNNNPTKDYDFADAAKKQYEAAALKKALGNGVLPHDNVWKNPLEALLPAQNPTTIFSDKSTYKAPIQAAQASLTSIPLGNYQQIRNNQETSPDKNIGGEYKLTASTDGVGGNKGGQSSGNSNHEEQNPERTIVLNANNPDTHREKKLNEVT